MAWGLLTPMSVGVLSMTESLRHDALFTGERSLYVLQEVLNGVIVLHNHDGLSIFGIGIEELCLQVTVTQRVGNKGHLVNGFRPDDQNIGWFHGHGDQQIIVVGQDVAVAKLTETAGETEADVTTTVGGATLDALGQVQVAEDKMFFSLPVELGFR